jgi:hypothetical protein
VDVFVSDWSFFMHVDELDQDNLIRTISNGG